MPIKTKRGLKDEIKNFIKNQNRPFHTVDVTEHLRPMAKNIRLHPNRISNYIRATGLKKEGDKWIPPEEALRKYADKKSVNTPANQSGRS